MTYASYRTLSKEKNQRSLSHGSQSRHLPQFGIFFSKKVRLKRIFIPYLAELRFNVEMMNLPVMKLDVRLQAVPDFVPEGGAVSDIGTDHGYLAAALVQERRAEHVIASDLNLGPCEAARRTVREQNLKEQVAVRQSDGLTVLAPDEVQTACIAGMGAALMADILENALLAVKKLQALLLHPMNGDYELHHYLYRHSWHVTDETLVVTDDRIYTVICAEKNHRKMLDHLMLEIGPVL